LEEVREAIRERLMNQQVSRRLVELAIECEDALKANASLEEIAERTQLPIRTVGPLSAGSLSVPNGPEPAVVEAAASLREGALSDVVETDSGVYIVRLTQREPARLPPLEEVRPAIVEWVVAQKARDAAKAAAETLRGQLQSKLAEGLALEEACRVLGETPFSPAPFTRTDSIEGVDAVPQVNAAAFAASAGQLTEVLDTPSAFVILMPQERLAADPAGLTDEERARLRDQLVQEAQQVRLMEWLEDVRARANLKSYVED
jgi:peptidyl-prolyl cis-trans isomerase D